MWELFMLFPETYARTCLKLVDAWQSESISDSVALIDHDPLLNYAAEKIKATSELYDHIFNAQPLPKPTAAAVDLGALTKKALAKRKASDSEEMPRRSGRTYTITVKKSRTQSQQIIIAPCAFEVDLRIKIARAFGLKLHDFKMQLDGAAEPLPSGHNNIINQIGLTDGCTVHLV